MNKAAIFQMKENILRKVANCHSSLASLQRDIISSSETEIGLRKAAAHCVSSAGHFYDLTEDFRDLEYLLEKASKRNT